jgi:hypothetical protein
MCRTRVLIARWGIPSDGRGRATRTAAPTDTSGDLAASSSRGCRATAGRDNYTVTIDDCIIQNGSARECGGAIFFVVDAGSGVLTIENGSVLQNNPSGEFENAPGIFDSVDGQDTAPVITSGSVVND